MFFTRDRAKSFEKRMGKPIREFEEEWQAWVIAKEKATRRRQSDPPDTVPSRSGR